ncbi:hypothetical protein PVK06_034329 [Gossypium arboreum]|uniref:Uncharacterized protein n=1 Tax=Gossypium arboreum TaxID=29729 RepID=A0ABR0NET9_GOSAR|nr:hypothetical protein PVK06_034329 [Gossypium arboreum]
MNEAKSLNEEIIVEDANAEDDISDGHDLSRKGIDGSRVIVVRSEEGDNKVVAVVLRGSTDSILDDLETAVDDCVNTCKAMCRDSHIAATEIELARRPKELSF